MKVRHREENAPVRYGCYGITTSRGQIVEVADDVGQLLLERRFYEPVTCPTVKDDGEVCGRDLPCRYHSEDD